MFEVVVNGKKTKAEVTFYTAWIYEAEFQSKLIQDYMGGQEFDEVGDENGSSIAIVKFDSIDWLTMTRVLWAAIKTAKDSTPSYEQWIRKAGGSNLWEARASLDEAITDCFFRSEAAGEEA